MLIQLVKLLLQLLILGLRSLQLFDEFSTIERISRCAAIIAILHELVLQLFHLGKEFRVVGTQVLVVPDDFGVEIEIALDDVVLDHGVDRWVGLFPWEIQAVLLLFGGFVVGGSYDGRKRERCRCAELEV